ncbi:MFS transporter [soil metagenome]
MTGAMQEATPEQRTGNARLLWTLFILTAVYLMSSVDRLLFGVVQEMIRKDLGLNDFQLGLLGGPAFALLYTATSFPIARFADMHNRVSVISLVLVAWSVMTAACGLATSFLHMLIARAGVSIGEAGCTPPSHSLISDMFPPSRRLTAISVCTAGGPVGALAAATLGAALAQFHGWRTAFFVCGALGIALAALLRLTVSEPARLHAPAATGGYMSDIRFLLGKRSYLLAGLSGALASFSVVAINQYFVSFLMRSHHLQLSEAGAVMGIAVGGIGIVSILLAGPITDIASKALPGIRTWLPATGMTWCGLFYVAAFQVADTRWAVALLLLASLGQTFWVPAIYAIAQDVSPRSMRATSGALIISILSVVGYGLGPPLVGFGSDLLSDVSMSLNGLSAASCSAQLVPDCTKAIADGLRWSLSLGAFGFVLAGLVFALTGRTIEQDLDISSQPG